MKIAHLVSHTALNGVATSTKADMFLCASGVEEAPIAPLEAMARDIPVVSTDVGNMGNLVPAHRQLPSGDIASMARAAVKLPRRHDLRAREGEMDRQVIAEKLAPSVIVPKIERIYAGAIASAWDRGASESKGVRGLHGNPAE